jgi:phage recombination protein Bet
MSNVLAINQNSSMVMWDDSKKIEEIRKLFAPKLTEMEFQFFVGLGRAANLNPFMREIWSIKYQDNSPAQVFIGRDGYRKAAQAHSEYDFHQCDAVYANDEFEVFNGEVRHKYKLTNRGELVGAYCIAKRHKSSRPIYVFAELKEYSTGKSLWNSQTGKPATMIKKVAESQCLRACFQDLLGGTYGEEEMSQLHEVSSSPKQNKSQELMDKLKSAKGQVIEAEVIEDKETGELATKEQLEEIHTLRAVKVFDAERFKNALEHYKVDILAQMTKMQAHDFIVNLNKLPDRE